MSITIEEMQKQVHNLAREKGWWPIRQLAVHDLENNPVAVFPVELDLEQVNIPEKLMLMVSELGEALEFYRTDNDGCGIQEAVIHSALIDVNKPDGFWVELADVIIRILDLAGAYNINMEELVKEKHAYNKTRPFRHGNKKC